MLSKWLENTDEDGVNLGRTSEVVIKLVQQEAFSQKLKKYSKEESPFFCLYSILESGAPCVGR